VFKTRSDAQQRRIWLIACAGRRREGHRRSDRAAGRWRGCFDGRSRMRRSRSPVASTT
jgi:hypothetical protein